MATLLAKNINGKGVIIFTHNELEYFYPYLELGGIIKKSEKKLIFKLYYIYYLIKSRFLKKNIIKLIEKLRKDYLIGIHWGFDITYIPKFQFVDFHLGFKKIENLVKEDFINYTSRNFSSKHMFNDESIKKEWDFISVSSNQKRKNLLTILKDFRKLYDNGNYYKLLLIIPSTDEKNDEDLIDYYYSNFSFEERDYISIIKLDKYLGFLGLSQKSLSYFYKISKFYISYSESEGEPRTIHEAQLCGLPIVFYNKQLGGGSDYLNEKNAVFFDNFENSHKSLIYAFKNYNSLKKNTLSFMEGKINTNNNIEDLKKEIIDLFNKKNLKYEDLQFINLKHLNLRLPTHLYEYSSNNDFINSDRFSTGNITNKKDLKKFINFIYK